MFSLGALPLNQTDPCGDSVSSNSLAFQSVFLPALLLLVLLFFSAFQTINVSILPCKNASGSLLQQQHHDSKARLGCQKPANNDSPTRLSDDIIRI